MTAKQRIERAVESKTFSHDSGATWRISSKDAVGLLLAERARLKRGVREVSRKVLGGNPDKINGYLQAVADILKLWEE